VEFARVYHTGLRKDGVTPEFEHQISIALYVRTLDGVLLHPDETLATVFLHDTREDYDVSDEEIRERFGDLVANAVDRMTKEFRGNRKDHAKLFEAMAEDSIASIAKGVDRIHNFQSMNAPRPCGRPTFGLEKQKRYIEEARQYFLPMLKVARRRFPCQEAAYENIKHLLKARSSFSRRFTGPPRRHRSTSRSAPDPHALPMFVALLCRIFPQSV
jgi:(p)ppGpp synthase/HD superfamily hydrolase